MTAPTPLVPARPDRPDRPARLARLTLDLGEHTDVELLAATRSGQERAFGELYRRHHDAVRRTARRIASGSGLDADDLAADAFARLLAALQRGSGPVDNPVPYLIVTMRNRQIAEYQQVARRRAAAQRIEDGLRTSTTIADRDPDLEAAMRSLAPRHRRVLWWTVVEGRKPQDIAPLLGISADAAAALSYRARRALAAAYHTHPTADRRPRRTARHRRATTRP